MATSGKITDWVDPGDKSGEFKRRASSFRDWISSEPGARYPPEKGRYHIYASYACPWAQRTLITRKLKGLEDIVSFSIVHWHLGDKGWRFVTAEEEEPGREVIRDPAAGHEGFTHLRDVYFESDDQYEGRITVPVLYDKKTKRIVSNESSEIMRMFGREFNHLIKDRARAELNLYPEPLQTKIDETNDWIYDGINNGVYKAGFATTSEAYERNVEAVFKVLDRAEEHMRGVMQRNEGDYFLGRTMTEVDIRLFVTLVRFDPVYVQHFKCNVRDIRSGYPALHRWMRRLYWNEAAFRDTTHFDHIKWHYTRSHGQINPYAITPVGPLPNILPEDEEVAAAMPGKGF